MWSSREQNLEHHYSRRRVVSMLDLPVGTNWDALPRAPAFPAVTFTHNAARVDPRATNARNPRLGVPVQNKTAASGPFASHFLLYLDLLPWLPYLRLGNLVPPSIGNGYLTTTVSQPWRSHQSCPGESSLWACSRTMKGVARVWPT
jgi:hypothetical protein